MLTFKLVDGKVTEVIELSAMSDRWASPEPGADYLNRNDFVSMRYAEAIAQQATELTGDRYVATDATASTSPRYDVIRAPKVGDAVSYTFNGDTYPDGHIVSVSDSLRVVRTDKGNVYYRRLNTGTWKQTGGTWSLTPGHRTTRNPHI